ncbi:hypothetical protein RUND412_004272 [Rhizina undulata]
MTLELQKIPKLSDLPAVYHQHPRNHATTPGYSETDPEILRESRENSSGCQTPITPGDLESSRPNTPILEADYAVGLVESVNNPKINRSRLASACLLIFTNGLNDAAPGALIPYIEKYYGIGYAIVSLIFLANAAGFIATAAVSQPIYAKLGRSKTMVLGTLLLAIGFSLIAATPPFGVVAAAFFFTGSGMALILAQANVFCSGLAETTQLFGYVHGSYGVGGTISPLIATAMASRGVKWSAFYFILLGLTVFNGIFAGLVFHGSEQSSIPQSAAATQVVPTALPDVMSRQKIFKKSLTSKVTLMTCLFIFAYQGAEVAIGGWTVSFLITTRKGDPAESGYIISGFWLGITLGRFVLTHFCHRFGERKSVFVLVAGAILFETLVWTVPSIISNAVSVSLVGLLLGPVYPCTMTIATRLLDKRLHISSIAIVSAVGSSGGAVAPFSTGLLAQKYGAWVVQPISVGLFVVMVGVWTLLPRIRKRNE